jgi:hypothetical protein|tara:strand:- start:687 stop:1196 length:510 start_codon:yes stop_codon:yes gene_type:complete
MATRARVALQLKEDKIIGSYQHWDGYPGGLGYNLIDNWYKADKVEKAIMLGDASKWGQFIGEKIDFDDREADSYDYQNVYYGRDRGEKDCNHKVYTSEQAYLENGFKSGEDYIYLGKLTGEKDFLGKPMLTWFYAKYDMKKFMPVEGEAIREHIESLKRHLAENVKEAA